MQGNHVHLPPECTLTRQQLTAPFVLGCITSELLGCFRGDTPYPHQPRSDFAPLLSLTLFSRSPPWPRSLRWSWLAPPDQMAPTLRPRDQPESIPPTPLEPGHSNLPVIHQTSPNAHIEQWLAYIVEQAAQGPLNDTIHICARRYGFRDGQDRTNSTISDWYAGDKDIGTLNEFMQAPKHGKRVKLGLFCSWPETWVGKTADQLQQMGYHAWLAMIVDVPKEEGKGRFLVIWDPDAKVSMDLAIAAQRKEHISRSPLAESPLPFQFRPRQRVMIGRQQQLAQKVLEKGRRTFHGVYYGGRGNEEGLGQCLGLTLGLALAIVRGEKGEPRKDWKELGLIPLEP